MSLFSLVRLEKLQARPTTMSGVRAGRIKKLKKSQRLQSRSVLRMMAVMQDRNSEEVPKEFLETGRTGRRNAMPDILHPANAEVTTADLPSRLENLVTSDADNPQPGSSKTEVEPNKLETPIKKDGCS